MSTLHTPTSEPEPPAETAPGTAPAAPKRSLIARLPGPVFVVGYGALLIAVVVAVAMFASYESGSDTGPLTSAAAKEQEPMQPWNPAPRDEDNVRESIRSYLITDVETGVTDTGVMLRGEITDFAVANLAEFTGHLSRLMQQNCLDTVVLTTPDNFRMEILGYCFASPDLEPLTEFTSYALEEDADSIAFVDYYGKDGKEIGINWLNLASDAKLEQLDKQWDKTERPAGFNQLRFTAYTPNEAYVRDDVKDVGVRVARGPRFTAVDETAERTTTPQPTAYMLSTAPSATTTGSPTPDQEPRRESHS